MVRIVAWSTHMPPMREGETKIQFKKYVKIKNASLASTGDRYVSFFKRG